MTIKNEFKQWLQNKQLAKRTYTEYLLYFDRLDTKYLPVQRQVDMFINKYPYPSSRAFIKNYIRFLLRNSEDMGLSDYQVRKIQSIEIPKVTGRQKKKIPRVLSEDDVKQLITAMPYEMYRIMTLISFYCGLRVGGLLGIKTNSFNWSHWKKHAGLGELIVFEKGNKEGIAIVPEFLMIKIQKWLMREYQLEYERGEFTRDSLIFPVSSQYWRRVLAKASQEKLGIHVHPHLLRHSYGTMLMNKGVDIRSIQELMRHSSIASTEIYTHVSKEKLKNTISTMFN